MESVPLAFDDLSALIFGLYIRPQQWRHSWKKLLGKDKASPSPKKEKKTTIVKTRLAAVNT